MSKYTIEFDFDELDFNLYEILNVLQNSSIKKIKKAYRRLIIKFHPDKNSEIEENIYYHLTLANQILTNTLLREKYDNWLKSKNNSNNWFNLKNNTTKTEIEQPLLTKDNYVNFKNKTKELEEKHGINSIDDINVMEEYKNINTKRKKNLGIIKEKFTNTSKFNDTFKNRKSKGKFDNQIIKSKNTISFYQKGINQNYACINDYSSLYVEDSIQTKNYSSLDRAFELHPELVHTKVNIKQKIKNYENETEKLHNLKTCDYKKKKYDEW